MFQKNITNEETKIDFDDIKKYTHKIKEENCIVNLIFYNFCGLFFLLIFAFPVISFFWDFGISDYYYKHPILSIIIIALMDSIITSCYIVSSYNSGLTSLQYNIEKVFNLLKNIHNRIYNDKKLIQKEFNQKFKFCAEYITDLFLNDYENFADYLENKPHPAHKKAQDVRELKQKTKEYIKEYKLMRYEYDMLFSLFP